MTRSESSGQLVKAMLEKRRIPSFPSVQARASGMAVGTATRKARVIVLTLSP